MAAVDELSAADTGVGSAKRKRTQDEVATALDLAMKRRKVGLRRMVDILQKAATKEEFLAEVEWPVSSS